MKNQLFRTDFGFVPSAIGFIQGFSLYLLHDLRQDDGTAALNAVIYVVLAAPMALILAFDRRHWRRDLVCAGLFGLLVGALAFRLEVDLAMSVLGAAPLAPAFALSTLLIGLIALGFYQARREAEAWSFSYERLFHHGWNNVLRLALGILFVGAVWLVLYLWGALFQIIGISFFSDLFGEDWFGWSFSGAAFGAGVAILNELDSIILAVRRLALTLFRFLGVVLALAGILFLCALPFTGLEPLWDTRHASAILLWVVFLTILFANATVDGTVDDNRSRVADALIMAMLVALPIYGAIAFYSTWLRVAQYGLTPDRVYALLLIAGALLYGGFYAFAVIRRGFAWSAALARFNPPLFLATAALAVLAHLPPLEAYGLSARSQLDMLRQGKIAATDFDLGFLKFRLGAPGREALAALRADETLMAQEEIAEAIERVGNLEREREWRLRQQERDLAAGMETLHEYVNIFPEGETIPADFPRAMAGAERGIALTCRNRAANAPRCTALRLDFDGDGAADLGFWDGYALVLVYVREEGAWRLARRLQPNQAMAWQDSRKALAQGAVETVEPRTRDLLIDGVRFD